MWRNPKYAAQAAPEPTAPPEPSGQELASFPRKGPDGAEQSLRIALEEYQGRPYISIRVWQKDRRTQQWWPTKRGTSLRISEAEGAIEAIEAALTLAAAPTPQPPPQRREGQPPPQRRPAGQGPHRARRDERQPPSRPMAFSQDFDETAP